MNAMSLLDEPVPDISGPILKPTKYDNKRDTLYNKLAAKAKAWKKTISDIVSWAEDTTLDIYKKQHSLINEKVEALTAAINNIYKSIIPTTVRENKTAIKGVARQFIIDGKPSCDAESFLTNVKQDVVRFLEKEGDIKTKFILVCMMKRVDMKTGTEISEKGYFHSNNFIKLTSTHIGDEYETAKQQMLEKMANYMRQGSNWVFSHAIRLEINIMKYNPLKGNSYIPLPAALTTKKAIINMKNNDDQCFKWCVTRALNPVAHKQERVTKLLREQSKQLNWDNIVFPVSLNDISKFEKHNTDIAVNIFGYETNIYPLRISATAGLNSTTINLLLISDDKTQHYCIIANMSRLLYRQTTHNHQTVHYCFRCLNGFKTHEVLAKHDEYCRTHEPVRVELKDKEVKFKNHKCSMRVPFIVYADFECFNNKLDTCQPNPGESYTMKYEKHIPSSFCYYIKCFDDNLYAKDPVKYEISNNDDDVAQKFVDSLQNDLKDVYNRFFRFPKKMIFTKDDSSVYKNAVSCHICGMELGEDRVRDHCHFTGKFRGAAHNQCNLEYRKPKFIPVVFHNLSGYDCHLFIKKLNSGDNKGKIACIPNNDEKYISFSKRLLVNTFVKDDKEREVYLELRFIDSFKFMASSLASLVNNLKKEQCVNLSKHYSGRQLDLLLRKGVYPYEYIDCIEKMNETSLPSKDAFYSRLNDENISDDDYKHAQDVWAEFDMKTLRQYHDLYNVSDVLLLCDVFENFRNVCSTNYNLDPAWYFTAPGLAWDAALKLTNVKLELLTDYDMILMIQNGMRGGISTITHRYGKANNKYMGDAYDMTKESKYVTI